MQTGIFIIKSEHQAQAHLIYHYKYGDIGFRLDTRPDGGIIGSAKGSTANTALDLSSLVGVLQDLTVGHSNTYGQSVKKHSYRLVNYVDRLIRSAYDAQTAQDHVSGLL